MRTFWENWRCFFNLPSWLWMQESSTFFSHHPMKEKYEIFIQQLTSCVPLSVDLLRPFLGHTHFVLIDQSIVTSVVLHQRGRKQANKASKPLTKTTTTKQKQPPKWEETLSRSTLEVCSCLSGSSFILRVSPLVSVVSLIVLTCVLLRSSRNTPCYPLLVRFWPSFLLPVLVCLGCLCLGRVLRCCSCRFCFNYRSPGLDLFMFYPSGTFSSALLSLLVQINTSVTHNFGFRPNPGPVWQFCPVGLIVVSFFFLPFSWVFFPCFRSTSER